MAATLHPIYLNHINWGKLIFAEDLAALDTLSLKGKRKRPESGYCNQALLFYEGALNNATYKAALAARSITEPMLQAGKTSFTNLKNMIPKKAKETGEAQQATVKRDAAWELFDNWFIEFKKYGKLGFKQPSTTTRKIGMDRKINCIHNNVLKKPLKIVGRLFKMGSTIVPAIFQYVPTIFQYVPTII